MISKHLYGSWAEICQIFWRFFGKFKMSKKDILKLTDLQAVYYKVHKKVEICLERTFTVHTFYAQDIWFFSLTIVVRQYKGFAKLRLSFNQSHDSSELSTADLYCDWLKLEKETENRKFLEYHCITVSKMTSSTQCFQ